MTTNIRLETFKNLISRDSRYSNYYYKEEVIKDLVDYTYAMSGNMVLGRGCDWGAINLIRGNIEKLRGLSPKDMGWMYEMIRSRELWDVIEFMEKVLSWKE